MIHDYCICDYQFGANFEEMFPAVLSCTTPNDRTVTSGEFFILLIFCTAIIPLLISGWRDGSHAVHNGCTPFVDMSTKLSCVCGLCRCLLITMNQFETHEPLRKKARPQFVPLTRPDQSQIARLWLDKNPVPCISRTRVYFLPYLIRLLSSQIFSAEYIFPLRPYYSRFPPAQTPPANWHTAALAHLTQHEAHTLACRSTLLIVIAVHIIKSDALKRADQWCSSSDTPIHPLVPCVSPRR